MKLPAPARHLVFSLLPIFLTLSPAQAQDDYARDWTPFPIVENGDTIRIPFWGGINVPKPSLQDFDGDGRIDLFIGDRAGKVSYFRNTGTRAVPSWTPVADRLGGIDIATWHAFADIDNDGDLDLFCDNRLNGAALYENINGTLTLADSVYGGFVTGVRNTPDFADLDADGDLDFFFGGVGGTLVHYRNDGTAESASFVFDTDIYDSISAFPGGGGGTKSTNDERHGFSSIEYGDIDADRTLDLLWGDINNLNLYLFDNRGDSAVSDLTYETDAYLPGNTFGFNHAALGDLDDDGDLDMIMGVANGADIDNLWFYRNFGDSTTPNFSPETVNLLSNFDIGSFAFPAIADLDNDGDLDMIVGRGDGRLTYLENTGSSSAPVLEVVSHFYAGIDVGTNASPELVDWDRDGDLDLLIGTGLGRIEYWRNEGSVSTFSLVQITNQLAGLKVDQFAIPRAADLDGDNRWELVLGEWDFNSSANILLYTDTASTGEPQLELVTNRLIPVDNLRNMVLPSLLDYDSDGILDIAIATSNLGLQWFENTTDGLSLPDSLSLVLQSDSLPGSDAGFHLAAAVADFDGDGDQDLIVGEADGGLNYFVKTGATCCVGRRGNVDGDPLDEVTMADITALADYLFITFTPPPCPDEADLVDGIGPAVTISDLIRLIDYLYGSFTPLPTCP